MKIAEIKLPKKQGELPKTLFHKRIRFKCTRCGTFCCHLGSPEFTTDDFNALQKRFGEDLDRYIEKREIKTRSEDMLLPYGVKSNPKTEGTECTFLTWDKKGKSGCGIYSTRPLLCRTFPFSFQHKGDRIEISVIPCPGITFEKKGKAAKGSKAEQGKKRSKKHKKPRKLMNKRSKGRKKNK